MGTFVVEEEDVLRLILGFLHAKGYFKAYCALETETKACAEVLSPELLFLRRMIHAGKWEETLTYLEPLRTQTEAYGTIAFAVRKQQYLEMLNSKKATEQLENAVARLRAIEPLCTQEEFNSLCFCLTLPRIQDNPDFATWNKHAGRVQCFDTIREELLDMYPSNALSSILPKTGLLELLRQALSYQERVAAAFGKSDESGIYYPHLHEQQGWLVLPSMDDALPALESKHLVHLVPFSEDQAQSSQRKPPLPLHQPRSQPPSTRSMSSRQREQSWETRPSMHSPARSKAEEYDEEASHGLFHNPKPTATIAAAATDPHQSASKLAPPVAEERPWSRGGQRLRTPADHKHGVRPSSATTVGTESLHPSRAVKATAPVPARPRQVAQPQLSPRPDASSTVHRSAVRTELILQAAPMPIKLHTDSSPLRTVSFFPGMSSSTIFALGTNARSLKIFRLNRHSNDDGYDGYDGDDDRIASLSATMLSCYNDIHRGSVYCCSWHGSERVLVTGSNDKNLCLIDTTREDAPPASLRAHNGTIRAVKFAKEGDLNKFVSGGAGDCIIRVWDAERARAIGELAGSDAPVHALAWCGRDLLLSGAESGALALWDVRDQRAVWSVNTLAGKGIFSIGWDDHASNRAVTGHADGLCVGWDLRQRKIFAEKQLHNADCRSMDFFPNLTDNHLPPPERRMIALSASFDGTISASQVVNGFQVQSTMVGHADKVLCAELHRSSGVVVSCGADAQVLAWRLYV